MANPTIGVTTPRIQYTATASQTVFTVPFEFLANADLAVYVNGVLKTLTTDYTLTGANTTGGGTLTFVTGRTAGEIVTILGDLAYSRDTNKYTKYGLLPAEVLEADFDAMQVQVKQLARDGQFALRAPLTDTGTPDMVLPAKATRATKVLGFDSDGDPVVSASSVADIDATVQIIDTLNALPAGASSSISYQPAGTGAVTTTVQAKLRETVSVKDFGAVGDGVTDDTAAFKLAIASGAKRIHIPIGTYLTDFTNPTYRTDGILFIPSGMEFFGDGEASVLRPYTNLAVQSGSDAYGCLGTDSGSSSAFSEGLTFRNLKFYGWSETTTTVNEHAGLLFLSGVKRVLIEKCSFVAPRGDAITIASGYGSGPANERHNFDVTIRDCSFDGINNKNRNAISVIDVDGIVIEGNTFRNFADSSMPGSIDFEPDSNYSVIKNVRVFENKFYNTNGNRGHLTFSTSSATAGALENIIVKGNHFENVTACSSICLDSYGATPTNQQFILIEGNTSINPLGDFIQSINGHYDGLIITGNTSRHLRGIWMHYAAGVAQTFRNLLISNNNFYGVGASSFGILLNGNCYNISIKGNQFAYSGDYHIQFGGIGLSQYISIVNNEFIGTPANNSILHSSTATNAISNICLNNRFDKAHSFLAARSDVTGGNNPAGADEATIPSDWPYGISCVRIVNRTIDGASQTGMLYTYNQVNNAAGYNEIWQQFMPSYNGTYKDDFYFRKAVNGSTWDSWWQVTGV